MRSWVQFFEIWVGLILLLLDRFLLPARCVPMIVTGDHQLENHDEPLHPGPLMKTSVVVYRRL